VTSGALRNIESLVQPTIIIRVMVDAVPFVADVGT